MIRAVERALESGSPDELADLLCRAVHRQLHADPHEHGGAHDHG